jgi:hypothetical protein
LATAKSSGPAPQGDEPTHEFKVYSFVFVVGVKTQKANIAFTPSQTMMLMVVMSGVAFMGLTVGTETTLIRAAVGVGVGGVFMWVNGQTHLDDEEQLPDAVRVWCVPCGSVTSSAVAIVMKCRIRWAPKWALFLTK